MTRDRLVDAAYRDYRMQTQPAKVRRLARERQRRWKMRQKALKLGLPIPPEAEKRDSRVYGPRHHRLGGMGAQWFRDWHATDRFYE